MQAEKQRPKKDLIKFRIEFEFQLMSVAVGEKERESMSKAEEKYLKNTMM